MNTELNESNFMVKVKFLDHSCYQCNKILLIVNRNFIKDLFRLRDME